jgi:hypothetical protein
MTDQEIFELFQPLHSDLINMATTKDRPPYVAHYTSLEVLEKIMRDKELWFSHPFYMNDLQEMRFGIVEGFKIFDAYSRDLEFITACGTPERAAMITIKFGACFATFNLKHALEIYVACFSSHDDPDGADGLLSMWRAYGANGDGAALIFKSDFLAPKAKSPLFVGKVLYASDDDRREWLRNMFRRSACITKAHTIPDTQLPVVATSMFTSMQIFSLLSKHVGLKKKNGG